MKVPIILSVEESIVLGDSVENKGLRLQVANIWSLYLATNFATESKTLLIVSSL